MKLKRLLITIPIVFIMVLSVIPLSVSAATTITTTTEGILNDNLNGVPIEDIDLSSFENELSHEYFVENNSTFISEKSYIWFTYYNLESDGVSSDLDETNNYLNYHIVRISLNNDRFVSGDYKDGVYNAVFDWEDKTSSFVSFSDSSYHFALSSDNQTFDSVYDRTYESRVSNAVYSSILYNPDNKQLTLYAKNSGSNTEKISKEFYHVSNIHSNMSGFPDELEGVSNPSPRLDVSFTPTLSGELDRKIVQNGVEAESNYFSMQIKNNSASNCQFAMLIVESGTSLSFQPTKTAQGLTGITTSGGKSIYSLMYDEWVYSPYGGGRVSSGHNSIEHEVNSKSVWHIAKGNSTYTRNFKWSQIPIEKGKEYDVVVCALSTTYAKPSLSFLSNYNYPHYLDITKCTVVYRSSFSVSNPVAYDSSDSEFGNSPNNGLVAAEQEANKGSAFVDDNGEVVVEDINGWEKSKDLYENWEPGIIEKDSGGFDFDFSLSSLQGILGQTTGFFNFLGSMFAFLPNWLMALVFFGVSALITIAIVKAVL